MSLYPHTRANLQIKPAMYSTINRAVAIIKPKIPFYQWLATSDLSLGITFEELREDCTAILIPEFVSKEEAIGYIEDIYEEIFEMELSSWVRDTKNWPKKRNLEMFREWFEVEIHSEVLDTVEGRIVKE